MPLDATIPLVDPVPRKAFFVLAWAFVWGGLLGLGFLLFERHHLGHFGSPRQILGTFVIYIFLGIPGGGRFMLRTTQHAVRKPPSRNVTVAKIVVFWVLMVAFSLFLWRDW
jgi:hypothetical protein